MKSLRWQPVALIWGALLGFAACDAQETPRHDPAEALDGGRTDGGSEPDAAGSIDARSDLGPSDAQPTDRGEIEPQGDAGGDALPGDSGEPADASETDAAVDPPVDASALDAGAGLSCKVGVDVINEAGQTTDSTQCRVTGPTGTCAQLVECICELISTPEDQEHCVWALLGPRALVALGDFCNDGRDLAEVLAIEDWQGNGPQGIRVRGEPDCSAVPAN